MRIASSTLTIAFPDAAPPTAPSSSHDRPSNSLRLLPARPSNLPRLLRAPRIGPRRPSRRDILTLTWHTGSRRPHRLDCPTKFSMDHTNRVGISFERASHHRVCGPVIGHAMLLTAGRFFRATPESPPKLPTARDCYALHQRLSPVLNFEPNPDTHVSMYVQTVPQHP